jgi:DNA invertase Pin-like site-specific DNA recombinase
MGHKERTGTLAYGRQSLGKDRSIVEQIESGRKRAAAEGWDILAEYSDRISASRYASRARDDWARLLARLERPDVNVLWLWESSRGDRKLSSWAAMLETCREQKVRIYVETHRRLYDMANGREWKTLAEDGVDSQAESDKTSERTKRAMDEDAAAGKPHSIAPYGYRNLHDERTGRFTERIKEPGEAVNIEELFRRIRQGHSFRAIARDWEARGIVSRPPKPCPDDCTKPHAHIAEGTPGRPFSAQTLRHLAMNPAYTALRVHLTVEDRKAKDGRNRLDSATEGDWEPIILREEFYAVREILTDPARKTTRPGRAVHLLSVSTAARCGECGAPFATEHRPTGDTEEDGTATRVWMYFCQKSGHVRIPEDGLDALATDAITAYLSRDDIYTLFTEPTDGPELERVRGELKAVRAARGDLANAVTRRGKSPAWALAADDDYERQITELEARERELATPPRLLGLIEPGPDVAARWAAAPVSARREVAQIVLSPGHLGVMKVQRGRGVPAYKRVTWDR